MSIDDTLLEILACPWCVTRPDDPPKGIAKGEFELIGEKDNPEALRCKQCKRRYGIEDGIPNLLVDEAVLEDA